ncbi:hypothetical protein ANCDUO_00458 [Ancylostoma duodenale]|uniref:Uncharacterized protein n=1 Tax=Ancylostoma duodenale TaxID=51022 RepID=A0A0C2HHT1_9BILA|nr:hypothetical protein ANCDUO_00458 [Ancylostoma duodenale]
MFDMSKLNDSLGVVHHNMSSSSAMEKNCGNISRPLREHHNATPRQTSQLSVIPEKIAHGER